MHAWMLNLRLALRQLRRTPGFALTVVLTLALGIGATTAIFSLVEGVLLRPLPFHDPASLISISDSITPPKLRALIIKHILAPKALSTRPDSAGPSSWARLAVAVVRDKALGRSAGSATSPRLQ